MEKSIVEKNRRKRYGKALLIFFLVMIICTVTSRAADAMTVPEVTVQKAESGKITYSLKGNGKVEAAQKSTCLLPAGFLVESCLEDGTNVEAGDVLIQFQMEHLEKRRRELETSLEQAELQLEQAKLNQSEDAWIPAEEEAQKTLNQAQTEYNQATVTKQQIQDNYNQNLAALSPEAEDYEVRKAELDDALETELAEAENRLNSAGQGLSQAQQNLESAKKSDDVTRRNNAKSKEAAGYSVESAAIDVENAEKNLQEAEELIAQGGKIYAEEKGIFRNSAVTAGTVTSGTEFISIGTGGLTFSAEVSKEAREKLVVGDEITIRLPGQENIKTTITQITSGKSRSGDAEESAGDNGRDVVILKAELPEETQISSEYASFSIEKKSEKYQNVLPLTAIHQDSKGYYCLGIRSQSTILGEEIKAERINLTLEDRDDAYAAVEGAIQPDTKIIVTSEKNILAGDRVRIEE